MPGNPKQRPTQLPTSISPNSSSKPANEEPKSPVQADKTQMKKPSKRFDAPTESSQSHVTAITTNTTSDRRNTTLKKKNDDPSASPTLPSPVEEPAAINIKNKPSNSNNKGEKEGSNTHKIEDIPVVPSNSVQQQLSPKPIRAAKAPPAQSHTESKPIEENIFDIPITTSSHPPVQHSPVQPRQSKFKPPEVAVNPLDDIPIKPAVVHDPIPIVPVVAEKDAVADLRNEAYKISYNNHDETPIKKAANLEGEKKEKLVDITPSVDISPTHQSKTKDASLSKSTNGNTIDMKKIRKTAVDTDSLPSANEVSKEFDLEKGTSIDISKKRGRFGLNMLRRRTNDNDGIKATIEKTLSATDPLDRRFDEMQVDKERTVLALFNTLDHDGKGFITYDTVLILENELYLDIKYDSKTQNQPTPLDIKDSFKKYKSSNNSKFTESQMITFELFKSVMEPYVVDKIDHGWKSKLSFSYDKAMYESKILDSWARWTAQSHKFDTNPAFLHIFIILVLITGALHTYGQYKHKTISLTSLPLVLALILVLVAMYLIWNGVRLLIPHNVSQGYIRMRQALKVYARLGFSFGLLMTLSWLFTLISIGILAVCFDNKYSPAAETPENVMMFFEVIFPWMVNILCLFGTTLTTLSVISYQWKLVEQRDFILLKRDKLFEPENKARTAADLLKIIKDKAKEDYNEEKRLAVRFKRNTTDIILHLVGVLMYISVTAGATELQRFAALPSDVVKTNKDYLVLIYAPPLAIPFATMYWALCISGAISVFCATLAFQRAMFYITEEPFRRNLTLMEYLFSTIEPVKASLKRIPFLALYGRDNVKCFLHIFDFFRNHEQDSEMGRASTGFAGLIIVDAAIILFILYRFFSADSWTRILVIAFYGIIVTYLTIRVLSKAVKINGTFNQITEKLTDCQAEVTLRTIDDTDASSNFDREEMFKMLKRVHTTFTATFAPITVLGIPATPTLSRVFFGYLFSAAIAILAKNFLNIEI